MGSEEIKKIKGLSKNVVKNIGHKEYLGVLFNKYLKRIQSKLHRKEFKVNCIELELIMFFRLYLSFFDDK